MFSFGGDSKSKDKDKADFFNMYLVDADSFWQEFEVELKDLPEARQEFVDWLHSQVRKRDLLDPERQHMKDLLALIYERGHRVQNSEVQKGMG